MNDREPRADHHQAHQEGRRRRPSRRRVENRVRGLRHRDDGVLPADVAHRLDGQGRPQGHRGVLPNAAASRAGGRLGLRRQLERHPRRRRRPVAQRGPGADGPTSPRERQTINLQAARAEIARRESREARRPEAALRAGDREQREALAVQEPDPARDHGRKGLQVTVVDEQNRAMFDTGGAALKDYTRDIMRAIGGLLNDVDNAISLAGHTDAVQYAGGERGYSNWELSADRANASRRELVAGGMNENKILRVVGLGSSLPLDRRRSVEPDESAHQPRRAQRQDGAADPRHARGADRGDPERGRRGARCSASAAPERGRASRHCASPVRRRQSRRPTGSRRPPASGSPPAPAHRVPSAVSAAAPHAFPLAPLLFAAERRAVERCAAVSGVLRAPVREVALVGVVARELAQQRPAVAAASSRIDSTLDEPRRHVRRLRRAAGSGGPTARRGRCAPSRRRAPTR